MRRTWLALVLGWLALLSGASGPADACTLWAAAGSAVASGGTLIAKNRDWTPEQQQLDVVVPKAGWRFYALRVRHHNRSGIKAAINERGLVVVSATVGSIPKKQRQAEHRHSSLMGRIMRECCTVAEAVAHRDWFYGADFLMLADRNEIAVIEIGLQRESAVRRIRTGVLVQTNHFVLAEMASCNGNVGAGSRTRFSRMTALLNRPGKGFSLEEFRQFSEDRHAGADDSIWRVGSVATGPRTLASWRVALPPSGEPQIVVTVANPGQPVTEHRPSFSALFPKR